MKIHYINILLFALPLNILLLSSEVNTHKKTPITQKISTSRLLCDCELYLSANYDNDPQMKSVIDNFNKQTQQRLHEYNERMKTTRQKCKEQCNKEIQKIILKDKIDKELTEKFATLQTDIQSDAIPTCVCEKSLADKTEKFCHNCGYGLGSVAPSIGLLGGPGIYGWKTAALVIAKDLAEKGGAAAGEAARIKEGINAVIAGIKSTFSIDKLGGATLESFFNETNYMKESLISHYVYMQYEESKCVFFGGGPQEPICKLVTEKALVALNDQSLLTEEYVSYRDVIRTTVEEVVEAAKATAETTKTQVAAAKTAEFGAAQEKAIEAASTHMYTAIGYSVLAILIIVLIMVIIYLILRYRRKKKMKKKLQYIKLLEE